MIQEVCRCDICAGYVDPGQLHIGYIEKINIWNTTIEGIDLCQNCYEKFKEFARSNTNNNPVISSRRVIVVNKLRSIGRRLLNKMEGRA